MPIGRGQRELIIGDRQTGKTAIAIDTDVGAVDNATDIATINATVIANVVAITVDIADIVCY